MPWRRWRLVSAFRQLQLHKFGESVTSNQICPWPVCVRKWVVRWYSFLLRCQATSSWALLGRPLDRAPSVWVTIGPTAEYVDTCWDPCECSGRNTLDASEQTNTSTMSISSALRSFMMSDCVLHSLLYQYHYLHKTRPRLSDSPATTL